MNFRPLKPSKLYKIDVLKAWDYAKTFFRSEKLHISYPKADTGTKITIFRIFLHIMHVHAPCMCAVYVLYASILCMYSMHVFNIDKKSK